MGDPAPAGAPYDHCPMVPHKNEVLAVALEQTNSLLSGALGRSDLQLELVSHTSARSTARAFERLAGLRRKMKHWDWEELFFKRARRPRGWMCAMVLRGEGPSAMCYGRIEVSDGYVSIDYLESSGDERLKGMVAPTAFQFARAIALLLDLDEVRLSEPFPELVEYYEGVLGLLGIPAVRHPAEGGVKFLSVKVQP